MSDDPSNTPQVSSGSALPYFLALAVLFVAAYGGFKWWQVSNWESMRGEAIPVNAVGPPLTEFELTERSGKPFRSADMKGKVWVASYFYTSCPGQCIRLNQNIKFMHDMPELKDVTWVSISVDPDNDSEQALRDYADRIQADPNRWLFCRADLDYTKRVGLGMNLDVYRQGHKDFAIVIDKTGKIRGMYDGTSKIDCEHLYKRLQECLEEAPPSDLASTPQPKTSS